MASCICIVCVGIHYVESMIRVNRCLRIYCERSESEKLFDNSIVASEAGRNFWKNWHFSPHSRKVKGQIIYFQHFKGRIIYFLKVPGPPQNQNGRPLYFYACRSCSMPCVLSAEMKQVKRVIVILYTCSLQGKCIHYTWVIQYVDLVCVKSNILKWKMDQSPNIATSVLRYMYVMFPSFWYLSNTCCEATSYKRYMYDT